MPLANAFRPMGFTPLDAGGRSNLIVRPRPVPTTRTSSSGGNASTDLAVGDAYAIDAAGNAYRAGPGDVVRGIVISFVLQANQTVMGGNGPVSIDYVTGTLSSAIMLLGIEDPTAAFSIQSNTFAASNIGSKVNLVDAAPDSTFRQSRQSVLVGTVGMQFQCGDILGGPGTSPSGGNPAMGSPNDAYGANAQITVRLLQTFSN